MARGPDDIPNHDTLGDSIPPDTPHVCLPVFRLKSLQVLIKVQAVSVSLPTWRSNVGYEEGEDWVLSKMQCGYPRSMFSF